MTAGPRALDARDSGLEEIGLIVERRHAECSWSTPIPMCLRAC